MGKFLEELRDGEAFTTELVVLDKGRPEPTKGKSKMMVLELADRTGIVKARFFGTESECNGVANSVRTGQVYEFSGVYEERFSGFKIHGGEIPMVTQPDWSRFSRRIEPDEGQRRRLEGYIARIADPHVRALVDGVLSDGDLMGRLLTHPAAVSFHHAFDCGLVTHVLEMLEIADAVCSVYDRIDRDVLFAGCILHDLGKVSELEVRTGTRYTDEGRLISHIPMIYGTVSEQIRRIDGFPDELAMRILHMILSHHGRPSWDKPSVMEPRTVEAVALHHIDMMSATISPIHEHVEAGAGWQKVSRREFYVSQYGGRDGDGRDG